MIPHNATHLVKFDTTTGDMTGYNGWPAGFTKGSSAFAGGVYDGTSIWLIPNNADRLIKVDSATGAMTGYKNWPSGFVKQNSAFLGGVYDGENIWMIPFMADRLLKFGDSSDLSNLTLSSGTLSPVFSPATTSYTATVNHAVTNLDVTPTSLDVGATVTVNGAAIASGQPYSTTLNIGDNTVTVIVTSANGDTKTYTITVTRSAQAYIPAPSPSNSSISPSAISLDKYGSNSSFQDISIQLDLKGNVLQKVMNGDTALEASAYKINTTDNTVILNKEYLSTLRPGMYTFVFKFNAGNDTTFTLTIYDNTLPSIIPEMKDINPEFWAYNEIQSLVSKGIILGYPNNEFRPNELIRREHMILMIARLGILTKNREETEFTDVSLDYLYYNEIRLAQLAGIIDGSDGNFYPKSLLTRAQAAKIITLLFNFEIDETKSFEDVPKVAWYARYVSTLATHNIVIGEDGYFNPNKNITRAQFAAMLYRSLQIMNEQEKKDSL